VTLPALTPVKFREQEPEDRLHHPIFSTGAVGDPKVTAPVPLYCMNDTVPVAGAPPETSAVHVLTAPTEKVVGLHEIEVVVEGGTYVVTATAEVPLLGGLNASPEYEAVIV
jgi:hypothetical protein